MIIIFFRFTKKKENKCSRSVLAPKFDDIFNAELVL